MYLRFLRYGKDFVRDPAHRRIGDLYAVDIPDMRLNVAGGHAFGVHRQDLLLDVLAYAGLILL